MPLPPNFNPITQKFEDAPVVVIPRNTRPSSTATARPTYRRESLWERFDNGVSSIGNRISDKMENISHLITMGVVALLLLGAVVGLIAVWVEEGFIWAIIYSVAAYFIGSIGGYLVIAATSIATSLALNVLRLLFWSGWTLLLGLIVAGGIITFSALNLGDNISTSQSSYTTATTPTTKTYECTATRLNIRTRPETNAPIDGVLVKGQKVQVYDFSGQFAKIKHNGNYRYVSTSYLRLVE